MISIVQNFICTKEERLKVLETNIPKIGELFKDAQFYVNYNTEINFTQVYDLYSKHITNLNFYNDLSDEWAPTTLSLVNKVDTKYTIFICEDAQIHSSYEKIHNCINEFIELDYDYFLLTKLDKYLKDEYINGYTPWNSNQSPGYKKLKYGYSYMGMYAPHKRVSTDAIYKTEWFKDRLSEFIVNGDTCTHDIPIRDKRKPNFYEGYYDFNNGMQRFGDMMCYIPDEVIMTEFEGVKQNR